MMALSQRQRWLILGGALLLTLAAVGWLSANGGLPPEVVEPNRPQAKGGDRPAARENRTGDLAVLEPEKFKRVPPENEIKNMFGVQTWYVAPPPPPRAPPPKPTPPPLPFTYLGKMLDNGRATVFLSKQDRNFAVRTGDVLEGSYRVDEIKPPMMTFTYLPLNMQQQLEIGRAQ